MKNLPPNLAVLDRREDLAWWLEQLGGRGPLAIDTEHTGFKWQHDRVGGVGLAANDTALYAARDALGPTMLWVSDQVKRRRDLVFHNAKGDLHHLRETFGLHVPYPVHDTLVQSFLLDNRGSTPWTAQRRRGQHELKRLGAYFIDPMIDAAEKELKAAVIQATGRAKNWKSRLLLAPLPIVGEYGAMDPWITLQLHNVFIERIRYWPQPEGYPSLQSLYETERWLILALRDMEERGVLVREEFFSKWKDDLRTEKAKQEKRLADIAGKEINWNSTPQLRTLLYDDLGLPVERWTKGGKKSGPAPSTDEVALVGLPHPIGAEVLKLRDINKQLTTYAEGLLNSIWDDGKIHCNFKGTGARTGRLAASSPNLQQVPRESGARRGFIPDPGLAFRFADYSQMEMRWAAHIANDPTLVHGFRSDPKFDTHAATAKKMWGLRKEPTKRKRKMAKIMNFAILYGAGLKKIASQLVSMVPEKEAIRAIHELGYKMGAGEIPHRTLADLLRKRYFAEFPAVRGASYEARDNFEQRGYVLNQFGRHRFLDEEEGYKSFNTEIQGSAADMAKLGLVNLYRELQVNEGSIALVLQIHDEAVYLSDGDPKTDRRVLEILNDTTHYRVPILATMAGSTESWQDKVDIEL